MKKKIFCVMALCMGLFSSCDKEGIGFEEPIVPPIEEPEKPSVIPSTDDLIRVKIDDDIMAIVGSSDWKSVTYGNGKYVAVGGKYRGKTGYVTTSTDGISWSEPITIANKPSNGMLDYLGSIAYGNGKFVAVGNADDSINHARVATSTDGTNWTECTNILLYENVSNAEEVIFADGKFVLITSTEFIISTDGTKWTKLGKFPNTAYSITYGGGKFVVGGHNGEIYTSTDGTNWITFDMDDVIGLDSIYCIAYGNGKFVTISSKGIVCDSTDGMTWTYVTTIELPSSVDASWCQWNCLRFIDGVFIAVGGSSYKEQKTCACSTDGVNWKFMNELTGNGSDNNDLCAVQ